MDPNETWKQIAEILPIALQSAATDAELDKCSEAADACDNLAHWIKTGGFIPDGLRAFDHRQARVMLTALSWHLNLIADEMAVAE